MDESGNMIATGSMTIVTPEVIRVMEAVLIRLDGMITMMEGVMHLINMVDLMGEVTVQIEDTKEEDDMYLVASTMSFENSFC